MRVIVVAAAVTALSTPALAAPKAPHLCKPGEKVLFACATRKGKRISVCSSAELSKKAGWLEYRFGTPGKVELTFPKKRADARKAFAWSYEQFVRSAAYNLHFTNAGYQYTVFDQNTMGSARDHGAGVTVAKGGKTLATLMCSAKGPETFNIERLGCVLGHKPGTGKCDHCRCPKGK